MPKTPQISARDCVKALQRIGFSIVKQKGSHIKMRNGGVVVIVPNHNPIKPKTLRNIIRQAGLIIDEFMALL